jgi:hypothetical protein
MFLFETRWRAVKEMDQKGADREYLLSKKDFLSDDNDCNCNDGA